MMDGVTADHTVTVLGATLAGVWLLNRGGRPGRSICMKPLLLYKIDSNRKLAQKEVKTKCFRHRRQIRHRSDQR